MVKHSAEQELRHASKSRRCSGRGFDKRLVEMKILETVLEILYINRAFVFNILYHHVGKTELFQILENLKSENNGNVKIPLVLCYINCTTNIVQIIFNKSLCFPFLIK